MGKSAAKQTSTKASPEPLVASSLPAPVSLFGLKNTGNTCFLNSVLQCLLRTAPILRTGHRCGGPQFCAFCALKRLSTFIGNCITPAEFLTNLRTIGRQFKLGRQEDAHEFLKCLVEKLEPRDCLRRIMEGKIMSAVHCRACGYSSRTSDVFWDLSLELTASTLTRCLRKFCSEEVLESDRFLCPQCQTASTCTKQLTISKAPQVLILHLKRFTNQGKKNLKPVHFPLVLSVRTTGIEEEKYFLYGVIVHDGVSCWSGHYYSFVLSSDGHWYEVNDSRVIQRDAHTTRSQGAAYILFYQRRTLTSDTGDVTRMKRSRDQELTKKLKKRLKVCYR